jgi:alpha-1,6-mannosyltransferase
VAVGLTVIALTAAGIPIIEAYGDLPFNALALIQGGLAILATILAARAGKWALGVIIVVAMVLSLVPLLDLPTLSTDVYRYVWDGRVQGHWINPYRYIPAAPELAFLRDPIVFPWINRADYAVTVYPPAAQMLFFLVGQIRDSVLAMRLALLALEAMTLLLLMDLLRRLGRPVTRVVAFAWHPLAIWEIAGSAHIDAAMVAFMTLGLWLMAVLRRPVLAAVAIATATLMKPLAALALPFAWRPWDWRAPAVAIGIAVLLYLPYLSVGAGAFGFLSTYMQEEDIANGGGLWLIWLANQLIGPQLWTRPLFLAGLSAVLAMLTLRLCFGEDTPDARLRALGWVVFAGVFALSPNYPWYYLVLLPFVTLFGTPAFWAATIGAFLLYDIRPGDPSIDFWIRDAAMQLSVFAALLGGWWDTRRRSASRPLPSDVTLRPASPNGD